MYNKLQEVEDRYNEISEKLYQPDIVADQDVFTQLMREHKMLEPIVEKWRECKRANERIEEAKSILADSTADREFKDMAQEDMDDAKEQLETINEELKVLLLPRDHNDDKNVIVEIRGGAGGEEAALFSAALYRMYSMYADTKGWKTEIINSNETE